MAAVAYFVQPETRQLWGSAWH